MLQQHTTTSREALIGALVADVRPVRPLWSPARRVMAWATLVAAAIGLGAAASLRLDVVAALRTPGTLTQVALLVVAAVGSAAIALRDAVPGSEASPSLRRLATLATGLALGSLALQPTTALPAPAAYLPPGPQCALCVCVFALLCGAPLAAAIRRGVALDGMRAGAWAGVASAVVGVAATRLACPHEDGGHLLAWHLPPVVLITLAALFVGRRVLAWQGVDAPAH